MQKHTKKCRSIIYLPMIVLFMVLIMIYLTDPIHKIDHLLLKAEHNKLQPNRWCFFPWASSSCFFASFFSWCSWKANPPAPTAAAAAISSAILWWWACSGSFLASCFSCYTRLINEKHHVLAYHVNIIIIYIWDIKLQM